MLAAVKDERAPRDFQGRRGLRYPGMNRLRPATIHRLQEETFSYFLHETNRRNGLVRDKTKRGWPASIAAVGMALTAYPVGVERG